MEPTARQPARIVVAHSGRQHSHQLALALQEAGLLGRYWTGVPATPPLPAGLRPDGWNRWLKYDPVDLPPGAVRFCPIAPVIRKLGEHTLPPDAGAYLTRTGERWFDRWVAFRLSREPATAVVAYENTALHTFQAARARGLATILDAASVHHTEQDRVYACTEPPALHAAITRQKDAEIRLADHILTVSELARESYLRAGVPPRRVTAVPVGADLDRFYANGRPHAPNGPVHFVFAGSLADRRKGFDTLLDACGRLDRAGLPYRLSVAAGQGRGDGPDGAAPHLRHLGRLSQAALAELFRSADCLVLPSRHESFGLVVIEALACGLPVLVSDRVGAKEALREGETGWIVPVGNAEALAHRMAWCIAHRDLLPRMQPAAVRAARGYTWQAYRRAVVGHLGRILGLHPSAAPEEAPSLVPANEIR